jgi:homoserine O-acetyltransferase/O-succinyltransferase
MRTFCAAGLFTLVWSVAAMAADYPAPKQGEWTARDFKFHTGEVLPEVKLHYTIIGEPTGTPVVALHGTGGSAAAMLGPTFAGELSVPVSRSMPPNTTSSFRMRLLSEGLGIRHVRLIIGNSMGGMNTWVWGERYPGYMDALVPMASQPTSMASRNWMLGRMMIENIRNDPEYNNGNYTTQPHSLKYAATFFGIATSGGTLNYQKQAPTRELADRFVDTRLSAPFPVDTSTSERN